MHKTLKLLKTHKCLVNHEILDFKEGKDFYYFKAKASVSDQSTLSIRYYVSSDDYNYSFHWQDKSGKMITRWDNAPHHKNLKTYPHHKHSPNLDKSFEVTLEEVLNLIDKLISK